MRFRGIASGLGLALWLLSACKSPTPAPDLRELAETFSESGGYFDTDNLISNETAYVQVVEELKPAGGIYIGVGPEQNFHYIGRLRPEWAFVVDVRRDNQLHHLLLNAILTRAETPYAYLCWLFARRCADSSVSGLGIDELLSRIDAASPDEGVLDSHLEDVLGHIERDLGFDLDDEDRGVIEFIYRSYFDEQLELRFRSHGRRPMAHHPTYRSLLVALGPSSGEASHFLARPEDYAYVRELVLRGRLVPVVGDFAGPLALRKIGDFATSRGEEVSAFYVSNVEFYLMRNGVFPDYVDNIRALPMSDSAQFIRAYFSYGYPHPEALEGHRSTLIRQNMNRFLEFYDSGAYRDYWDVSTVDYE